MGVEEASAGTRGSKCRCNFMVGYVPQGSRSRVEDDVKWPMLLC